MHSKRKIPFVASKLREKFVKATRPEVFLLFKGSKAAATGSCSLQQWFLLLFHCLQKSEGSFNVMDYNGCKGTYSSIPKLKSAVTKTEKQRTHKNYHVSNIRIMATYGQVFCKEKQCMSLLRYMGSYCYFSQSDFFKKYIYFVYVVTSEVLVVTSENLHQVHGNVDPFLCEMKAWELHRDRSPILLIRTHL